MRHLILPLIFLYAITVTAQDPFENEIKEFKRQDSLRFPGRGKILFVGSSSFRLWKEIHNDFPGHAVINRGFGGSTMEDVLRYTDEIVLPYHPRQVVIYCGENDLAKGTSPDTVFSQFTKLFSIIRHQFPKAHIVYVSIKPSPSRKHLLNDMRKLNEKIRGFLTRYSHTAFVDVFSLMLGSDGAPREELFIEDRLHMNRAGYNIWKRAIEPFLL